MYCMSCYLVFVRLYDWCSDMYSLRIKVYFLLTVFVCLLWNSLKFPFSRYTWYNESLFYFLLALFELDEPATVSSDTGWCGTAGYSTEPRTSHLPLCDYQPQIHPQKSQLMLPETLPYATYVVYQIQSEGVSYCWFHPSGGSRMLLGAPWV